MAPEGFPFYSTKKRGGSYKASRWAAIGHFQKVGLVGRLALGCLLHCQTLNNLIRDLINQLREVSARGVMGPLAD